MSADIIKTLRKKGNEILSWINWFAAEEAVEIAS